MIKNCKYLVQNQRNMSNVHPLEVVGRGSETQLQVGENFDSTICCLLYVYRFKYFLGEHYTAVRVSHLHLGAEFLR